jgi:hypothetical protein
MIGYVYPTGRVTRHEIRGLPAPSPEELVELLEKELSPVVWCRKPRVPAQ